MATKHEATNMGAGPEYRGQAPSRKTPTWYVDFQCPSCKVLVTRNANRSEKGLICYGNKQVSPQLSEARARWRAYDDARPLDETKA